MYEFTGTVKKVCELQTFASGFTTRDLVVEEEKDSQWPNPVAFTFKKDNTAKLDGIAEGTRVKVGFVIDGREWNDPKTGNVRYFTDLTGWKVEVLNGNGTTTEPVPEAPEVPADIPAGDDPENLPF